MRKICSAIFFTFLLVVFSLTAWAGTKDVVRSEVEVYGNVQFLLRITEKEKFQLHIYSDSEEGCKIDIPSVDRAASSVLKELGRLAPSRESTTDFRVDIDYFTGYDGSKHCLVSYEVYLTKNLSVDNELIDLVEEVYDYENSNPLLKMNGILHVQEDKLNEAFQAEAEEGIRHIFSALGELRSKVEKRQPRK